MTFCRRMLRRVTSFVLCLCLCAVNAHAYADVVAVVSSKSAITSLSNSQIADIFLGRTSRFPDGELAIPVDLAENSRVRDAFYDKLTGKSPAQVKTYWSKIIFTGRGRPPKTVADSAEMKKFMSTNPNAIGYLDEKSLDVSVRVLK